MGNGRADRGNVTHLLRVADGHSVKMADKLFPNPAFILHVGLDTELSLNSLGRNADNLLCKGGQLGDHCINRHCKEGLVAGGAIAGYPEREIALDNSSSDKSAMVDTSSARDLLHGHVGARKGKG